MKNCFIREEKQHGCSMYSIINAATGNRVNYSPNHNSANDFINRQDMKDILKRLSNAVCGSERDIFAEEELIRFANYIIANADLTDGEEIADWLVVYARDTKKDCRRCSVCGKLFREGYVESMGNAYYCSDGCLHTRYTDEEWRRECEDDNQSYFTEF